MTEESNQAGGGDGAAEESAGGTPEESLSYEQARDELTAVVRRLEAGGLTLQESLELWERGERLARTCEEWLEGARAKLAVALAEEEDEGQEGEAAKDTPF